MFRFEFEESGLSKVLRVAESDSDDDDRWLWTGLAVGLLFSASFLPLTWDVTFPLASLIGGECDRMPFDPSLTTTAEATGAGRTPAETLLMTFP